MSDHRSVSVAVLAALLAALVSGCGHLVILHDPLSAAEHNDLGVSYEQRGEWNLAARQYRRALKVDSRYARARVNLGNVAARGERWAEAERHYRRALPSLPDDPDVRNNLAVALMRQGRDFDEAERLALAAIARAGAEDSLYRATLAEVRLARPR
jgi:Flp pilus assembly protein TadD